MKSIPEFKEEFEKYIRDIEALHRKSEGERKKLESTKMKTFFSFLERVTGLRPEEYSYDAFVVKGSKPDAVTGNVIVEFEDNLSLVSEVREAESQLKNYVKELYSQNPRRYWAIASDGIRFILYKPLVRDGDVILERIDEIDVTKTDPRRFYWFIYEYFFEERFLIELKPEDFVLRVGYGSRVFREMMNLLRSLWNRISNTTFANTIFSEWSKYYTYVAGKEYKDVELFIRHTYLAILAKILAYIYLEEGVGAKLGDIKTLEKVLTGEYFRNLGLEIFERDYFSWVIADEIKSDFLWGVHDILLKELLSFDYSKLNTDVFKEIYQNIIEHDERAALGEYYTPDFIAELMLGELLTKKPEAKILDPACGSGTFLFIAIKLKKELLKNKLSRHELLSHILNSVVGIDINPVAVIIARANYLIAIKDLLPARGILRIPVYLANAITIPEHEKDKIYIEKLSRSVEVVRIEGASEKEYFFLPSIELTKKLGIEGLDALLMLTEDAVKLLTEEKNKDEVLEEIIHRYIAKLEKELGVKLASDEQTILAYILLHNAKLLHKYVSSGRNTFWLFLLINQYKVLLLREQFDIVVGNPPWVSRTEVVESERFRKWYDRILDYYQISLRQEFRGAPADTAIIFVVHSVDYYLKEGGYLYFVVPAALKEGYQYEVIRQEPRMAKIHKIVSLENVRIHDVLRNRTDTIFNVPCILLLVRKEKEKSVKEIAGVIYSGTITYKSKNVPFSVFDEAVRKGIVKVSEGVFTKGPRNVFVFKEGKESGLDIEKLVERLIALSTHKESPYLKRVVAGISAYPRNFILVHIQKPKYGLDPEHIYVKTHPRAIERKGEGSEEKEKWIQILEGRVSYKYLYLLVTGDNVFPFGIWGLNLAILPAIADYERNAFVVLKDVKKVVSELGEWYLKGIKEYYEENEKREPSEDDKRKFLNWLLNERINYQNKFEKQKPRSYSLVYNASGDALNIGVAVIDKINIVRKVNEYLRKEFGVNSEVQLISGIVIDYTNYVIEFDNAEEAHYLCAILQSTPIRQAVHRLQPRGKKGERHITDRPLHLPIPEFITDEVAKRMNKQGIPTDDIKYLKDLQLELAKLSMELHDEVEKLLEQYVYSEYGIPYVNVTDKALAPQSVAAIRKRIRKYMIMSESKYQERIDKLTVEIINLALGINMKSKTLLDYIKL